MRDFSSITKLYHFIKITFILNYDNLKDNLIKNDLELNMESIQPNDLIYGETYHDSIIADSFLPLHFDNLTFINCTFEQTDFSHSDLLDCHFTNCDFANCSFEESAIYRSKFKKCRLTGTNFSECRFKDSLIDACDARYATFSFSKTTHFTFENTNLSESLLQQMTHHKDLIFDTCDLEGADFTQTNLDGINLANSEFEQLLFSTELMRGCSINAGQAAIMLHLLGIQIQ